MLDITLLLGRIQRLERVVLGLAAMVSGEAAKVTTSEDLAVWQSELGKDMQAMADEVARDA